MTESPEHPGSSTPPNPAINKADLISAMPAMAWLDRGMTSLKRRERFVILGGVALQIVLLLLMVVLHSLPLLTG